MSFTSPTPVWSTYLDLAEDAKPMLQYPKGKVDEDTQLQRILDAACWWVQDYIGRAIAPTQFFYRFDGWTSWQGSFIMLPYYPVLKIVKIVEWWGNSGPHALAEQTPQSQFGTGPSYGNADVYQLDAINGKIIRTFPGLVQKPFFPGSRNIEVTWIAGYSPIPPTIMIATLELFTYWYRNTMEAPREAGPTPYGDGAVSNDLWPAIPNRVTMMLEPYLHQGIG